MSKDTPAGLQLRGNAKLIFLVGMPAAGKTYWGRKWAEAHGWDFTDLDAYIATQEHASIPALFASYGEAGFRERESKHLAKLINTAGTPAIVACGGGTPCYHGNMQLMKEAGTVVYLQSDISFLSDNLLKATEVRPLLRGKGDIPAYLAALLKERKRFYEQAQHILDVKYISITTFTEIIASCINRQ